MLEFLYKSLEEIQWSKYGKYSSSFFGNFYRTYYGVFCGNYSSRIHKIRKIFQKFNYRTSDNQITELVIILLFAFNRNFSRSFPTKTPEATGILLVVNMKIPPEVSTGIPVRDNAEIFSRVASIIPSGVFPEIHQEFKRKFPHPFILDFFLDFLGGLQEFFKIFLQKHNFSRNFYGNSLRTLQHSSRSLYNENSFKSCSRDFSRSCSSDILVKVFFRSFFAGVNVNDFSRNSSASVFHEFLLWDFYKVLFQRILPKLLPQKLDDFLFQDSSFVYSAKIPSMSSCYSNSLKSFSLGFV